MIFKLRTRRQTWRESAQTRSLFTFFFPTLVCKKEECAHQALPDCPAHRLLSVKKTKCCDVLECVCNCQNSTQSCTAGFITTSSTNDCGCTETSCLPDNVSVSVDPSFAHLSNGLNFPNFGFLCLQVCVVGVVVHPVGSTWEEGCEKCSCTQLKDKNTSLHLAQCTAPTCDRTCPLVRHRKCQTLTFDSGFYDHCD